MRQIWKQKIDELDKIITVIEIGKDGILIQLHKKRALLEQAFGNCKSGS
jgi:hypothetical protein